MGIFKEKIKECHRCACVIGNYHTAYSSGICPYCGEKLVEGPRINEGKAYLRQKEIYEQFVKNIPESEECYLRRLAKEDVEDKERVARWKAKNAERAAAAQANACVPKCPTCGSTNVQRISTASRLGSTMLFGLASSKIGKTMECKNCGYKW